MKHLINLERLKVHLSNKFKTTLNEIDEFLQLVVFRHEISELKYKEFELLIGESKQELMGFLVGYALDLSNDWQELYNYSYTLETKMVDDDKLDTLNINEPQFDADSPIKLSAQVGVTLNQILAKFGDEQSTKISNAISYAYANGLPIKSLFRLSEVHAKTVIKMGFYKPQHATPRPLPTQARQLLQAKPNSNLFMITKTSSKALKSLQP